MPTVLYSKRTAIHVLTFFFTRLSALAVLLLSMHVSASPWVGPGEDRIRHHLQTLVDGGHIQTPITTWPIMWSNLESALKQVNVTGLSKNDLWSYQYLKHASRRAQESLSFKSVTQLSNKPMPFSQFDSVYREETLESLSLTVTGQSTAANLQVNYAHNPSDNRRVRADGSYFTRLFGNWALGVGAIDRWWGPGWHNSLIMSNVARPTPGIFVQRNAARPFESKWLNWLGPWQLTTFMNQLESGRGTPDARLWGMRVSFRPLQSLELGLSRTAMWAGEGRPGDLDTFMRLLAGKDNRGDSGTTEENEPGNQLAGVDWRWGRTTQDYGSFAFYGQLIGEDEANGMPSRHIGLAGLEYGFSFMNMHQRLVLETANTTVYFYESDKLAPNVAYNHPLYTSGYRYYGRPLGASVDNDAEVTSLRYYNYFDNGHALTISLANYNLNRDGTGENNIFGSQKQKVSRLNIDYTLPLSKTTRATFNVATQDQDISFNGEQGKTYTSLMLEMLWH